MPEYGLSLNSFELGSARFWAREMNVQYPLSPDEHTAMARYVSGIRKQLQEASDLFTARYGRDSSIAEVAVRTLVSATLLEHEIMLLEGGEESAELFTTKVASAPY